MRKMGMMKRLGKTIAGKWSKLKSDQRGETLVETLVSILICAFAVTILMTSVASSTDMNQIARKNDKTLYAQQVAAASSGAQIDTANGASSYEGTVQIDGKNYSVQFFGGDDVVSYKITG